MRDNDKSKVYGAEQHVRRLLDSVYQSQVRTVEAYGSTLTLPDEVLFGEIGAVQHYVDRVLALDWVQATWPTQAARPVTVRPRKGSAKAHYEPYVNVIAVPPREIGGKWAMREIVVLHEIAHHLTPPGSAHGAEFVGVFLLLVREVIGPEVGLLLTGAMHEAGAKIRPVNRVDRTAC